MLLQLSICISIFLLVFYTSQLLRKTIRGFSGASLIRNILFFFPFLIPSLIYGIPIEHNELTYLPYVIALGTSILGIMFHINDYKVFMSIDIYSFMKPINKQRLYIMEFSLIGSAIFEELFYRSFLPNLLSSWALIGQISICAILFTISHFLQGYTRDSFSIKSYIVLFFMSIGWAMSYKISGSIVPAIAGHLLFNLPNIIITFMQYYLPGKTKEKVVLER